MNDEPRHQVLREMLGAYALGHLDEGEAALVRAHLDGCAPCRADLQEILPVARLLDDVDPAGFESPPTPPVELGDTIRAEVSRERSARETDELAARRTTAARGRRRRLLGRGLVAAALLVAGVAVGGVVGRVTAPEVATVPTEPIAMAAPRDSGVTVQSADLVAHTWGVELRIEAEGFADGRTFRASFRTENGRLVPAGEFLGVGADPMTCFLQSAVLREDVTEVLVTDARGKTVLTSSL